MDEKITCASCKHCVGDEKSYYYCGHSSRSATIIHSDIHSQPQWCPLLQPDFDAKDFMCAEGK